MVGKIRGNPQGLYSRGNPRVCTRIKNGPISNTGIYIYNCNTNKKKKQVDVRFSFKDRNECKNCTPQQKKNVFDKIRLVTRLVNEIKNGPFFVRVITVCYGYTTSLQIPSSKCGKVFHFTFNRAHLIM